jgi:acyl carrier protein
MADTDAIMPRLRPLLRETFPDGDADAMGPETMAADVVGWDSMAHVGLMTAIEEEFQVRFEPEEITAFADLGELVAMIARKVDHG